MLLLRSQAIRRLVAFSSRWHFLAAQPFAQASFSLWVASVSSSLS